MLKGQSDPQTIFVLRGGKYSKFGPQQEELTFLILCLTTMFSLSYASLVLNELQEIKGLKPQNNSSKNLPHTILKTK